MKPPRFSVKKLMAILALVAVVVAALARPNYGWANFLSAAYVLMLLVAPLGIILRRGPSQARWIGFGLFGWSFFLFATLLGESIVRLGQIIFFNQGVNYGFNAIWLNVSFLTRYLLNILNCVSDRYYWDLFQDSIPGSIQIDFFSTTVVVLSLMGLAFALLGGQIARFLARGGPFDPPPTTPA